MINMAIAACKRQGKYIGICGQGPSDHPDFAQWLVGLAGISSISLNPEFPCGHRADPPGKCRPCSSARRHQA
jgi:phosphoenolpyruvate-protein kinase (PTS system EI component)